MVKMWYKGRLVLTTEQVADILGTTPKNILWNFDDSREFFVDGEDFFKLDGDELKAAKAALKVDELIGTAPTGSFELRECAYTDGLSWKAPTIGKRAAVLTLWTRYGFMHHVKMANTPQAWAVYKQIERVYFAVVDGQTKQLEQPLTLDGNSVWTIDMATRIFGKTKGQIQSKLQSRKFARPADCFVTNPDELKRLRNQNQRWFQNCITLITERGMQKLRALFVELQSVQQSLFEAPREIPQDVKDFGRKLKERAQALLDVGKFLDLLGDHCQGKTLG